MRKIYYILQIWFLLSVCLTSIAMSQSLSLCAGFDAQKLNLKYATYGQSIEKHPFINSTLQKFDNGTGIPISTNGFALIDLVPGFGTNQALRLSEVSIKINYKILSNFPTVVSFDYRDLGGIENFSVNGSKIQVLDIAALPTSIGAVKIAVTSSPLLGSGSVKIGKAGRVELKGKIKEFLVGGQEFWVDNICNHF